MLLENIVNLWLNNIYPTFINIVDFFITPLKQILNNQFKDIPILSIFLEAIIEIAPNTTLIEFILGSSIFLTISITFIKWIIGIVT